jgi:hypothetical protein
MIQIIRDDDEMRVNQGNELVNVESYLETLS